MKIFILILPLWMLHASNGQYVQWSYNYNVPPPQIYHTPQIIPPQFFHQTPIIPRHQSRINTYQAPFQFPPYTPVYTPAAIPAPFIKHVPQTISYPSPIQRAQLAPTSKNYRGFGYNTVYDDGATSTVVFFSGLPSDNVLRNQNERVTVASDSLDPQQARNIEEKIQSIFQAGRSQSALGRSLDSHETNLASLVRSLIENPQTLNGLVHFYATDDQSLKLDNNIPKDQNQTKVEENQSNETVVNELLLSNNGVEPVEDSNNANEEQEKTTTSRSISITTEATISSTENNLNETDTTTSTTESVTTSSEAPSSESTTEATSTSSSSTTTEDDTVVVGEN